MDLEHKESFSENTVKDEDCSKQDSTGVGLGVGEQTVETLPATDSLDTVQIQSNVLKEPSSDNELPKSVQIEPKEGRNKSLNNSESVHTELENNQNDPPSEISSEKAMPNDSNEGEVNTLMRSLELLPTGPTKGDFIQPTETNELVQVKDNQNDTSSEGTDAPVKKYNESGDQLDIVKINLPSGSKQHSKMTDKVKPSGGGVSSMSRPQQPGKLISDRIAFEVPIITDEMPEITSKGPKSIFTEVTGPSFYSVNSDLTTLPIIPKNLPGHFASLPVFGAPQRRDKLAEFYYEKIKDFVGSDLKDDEFEKLANYCSPNHLRTGAEISMPVKVPSYGLLANDCEEKLLLDKCGLSMFNDVTNLCIHKKHKLRVDKDIANLYNKRLKYRGVRLMPLASEDSKTASTVADPPDLSPGKDMLFRVRIYRPYDYNIKYFRGRSRHAVFCCDVVAAGRQPLTALRDRIVCANDVGMRVDVADNPDDQPQSSAKEVFPSGFLFINNVFYVDTRPGCVDHAAELRAWARRKGIGDFPSRDMNVTFEEITVRLGYPEVYVHQGNCEHLFTFSEIRLVGPSDPLRLSQYPGHTAASNSQSVYCTTCAEFCAKWVVVGCSRVPFDPAFFCDTCFRLYLYKDGKKVCDFKAYCYRGNELNMVKPLD